MTTLADIQRRVGVSPDGVWGPKTAEAIAKALGMLQPGQASQDGLKQAVDSIKHWEGCRLTAYPDPGTGGAPWTIGFGSTRDINGAAIKPGTTWTLEQAEQKLAYDVAKFGEGVGSLLGSAPTTANQWAALVSFAYNVGLQALKESTLLRKHKEGDYEGAAHEFLRWTKASGKELPGLVKRRDAESKLYRGVA